MSHQTWYFTEEKKAIASICHWSLPWCPWNAPVGTLQFPHWKYLCALSLQKRSVRGCPIVQGHNCNNRNSNPTLCLVALNPLTLQRRFKVFEWAKAPRHFLLVKGNLWGNCKFLLEHFEGTKIMTSGHGGNRLHCLHEVSGLPYLHDTVFVWNFDGGQYDELWLRRMDHVYHVASRLPVELRSFLYAKADPPSISMPPDTQILHTGNFKIVF